MAGHMPCDWSGIFAFTWTYQPLVGRVNFPSVVTTPLIQGYAPEYGLSAGVLRRAVSVSPLSTAT